MLGYMTAEEALKNGFTHHGKYYGIPVWIAEDIGGLMVATKWLPMEYVMTLFHYIEQFVRPILYPDEEPCFQFLMGDPIKK